MMWGIWNKMVWLHGVAKESIKRGEVAMLRATIDEIANSTGAGAMKRTCLCVTRRQVDDKEERDGNKD